MRFKPQAARQGPGLADMIVGVLGVVVCGGFLVATALGALPAREGDVAVGGHGVLYPTWVQMIGEARSREADSASRIAGIDRALAAQGMRLVLVAIPAKARAAGPATPDSLRRRADHAAWLRWLEGLRADGVEAIDARAAIGPDPFLRTDTHWTAAAAERAAAATAQVLSGQPLIGSPGEGQQQGPLTQVALRGDLARLLARRGRAAPPPEVVWMRTHTPAAGEVAVRVVGSSFAASDHGFPQALSARLDRRVVPEVEFGEDGAWRAMAVRLSAPPEPGVVVVWLLTEGAVTAGPP